MYYSLECFDIQAIYLQTLSFAWIVSSELLGFWFYFFLIFSFLGRALD